MKAFIHFIRKLCEGLNWQGLLNGFSAQQRRKYVWEIENDLKCQFIYYYTIKLLYQLGMKNVAINPLLISTALSLKTTYGWIWLFLFIWQWWKREIVTVFFLSFNQMKAFIHSLPKLWEGLIWQELQHELCTRVVHINTQYVCNLKNNYFSLETNPHL